MKYFTPELLERVSSPDDDVADAADRDWERAIRAYNRRWRRIQAAFPRTVQRFDQDHICLHDALVLSLGRQNNTFVFVLQMEPPSQKLVILTFALNGEPEIDTTAFPSRDSSGVVAWLYEEWDLDRDKQRWFEVLLSNGWSVKLPFREFRYLIGEQLLHLSNGKAIPGPAFLRRSAG